MRKVKYSSLILMIAFMLLQFCGCWNYREVNDMPVISGAGIDIDDDEYVLSSQIIGPTADNSQQENANIMNYETRGLTLFEAVREIIMRTGKKVFWAHEKYILLSEELAEKGTEDVFDFFTRNEEARDDMWVFICEGKTSEYLKYEVQGNNISYFLNDLMRNAFDNSKYYERTIYQFQNDLVLKGKEGLLPYMRLDESIGPVVIGNAVFKDDKMVGIIDKDEVRNYRIIVNEELGGILSVAFSQRPNELSKFSIEIDYSSTNIKPEIVEDTIFMNISVKTFGQIGELVKCQLNNKTINVFQDLAGEKMKEGMHNLILKMQKEYNSDIFGFGEIVKDKYPGWWKKNGENWYAYYDEVICNIDVLVDIVDSGLYEGAIRNKE